MNLNLPINEVAKKMGRSREYVSNSLRILSLPEEILTGVSEGKITDGHTRPTFNACGSSGRAIGFI